MKYYLQSGARKRAKKCTAQNKTIFRHFDSLMGSLSFFYYKSEFAPFLFRMEGVIDV